MLECTIENVVWHAYHIPLRSDFRTAHGTLTIRSGAVIEIHTTTGITGMGEIAPLPAFGSGTLHTALACLPEIAVRIQGKRLADTLKLLYNEADTLPASAICALESALLDALGKSMQRSVSALLAPTTALPRASVRVNAVIGASTAEEATRYARAAVQAGFGCIKLKMGSGEQTEIERVAAVRAAIGPAIHLRLDANEAWDFAQARTILTGCARFDIQYIEQPLAADDLLGMQRLRQAISIPIAADEALYDLDSARRILAAEAADVLIIKPQLAGGLRVGRQIMQEAAAQHVQCVVTSTIEAGIGLAGALHLAAASPEVTLECGLATLHLLEDDLLSTKLVVYHSSIAVPTGPGLGIQLDRQALTKYSNSNEDASGYI